MVSDISIQCFDRTELMDKQLAAVLSENLGVKLGTRNQLLFVAFQQDKILGALLAFRRPTISMVRLVKLWRRSPGDIAASDRALFFAFQTWSENAGIHEWRMSSDRESNDLSEEFVALLRLDPPNARAPYRRRWVTQSHPASSSQAALYTQSTDFTCGAACLMMGFARFDPSLSLQRGLEVQLWREASSIVSLDGPGGCDPYGVALAAATRGFGVRVFISTGDAVLIEAGDTAANRDLIEFVQAELRSGVIDRGVQVEQRAFSIEELRSEILRGAVAIVLIDQLETHGRVVPHWILVHSAADDVFLVNDPWYEKADHEQPVDVVDLPIRDAVLDKMSWYGAPAYRAAVLIEPTF